MKFWTLGHPSHFVLVYVEAARPWLPLSIGQFVRALRPAVPALVVERYFLTTPTILTIVVTFEE